MKPLEDYPMTERSDLHIQSLFWSSCVCITRRTRTDERRTVKKLLLSSRKEWKESWIRKLESDYL